jgi:hypothetical protein
MHCGVIKGLIVYADAYGAPQLIANNLGCRGVESVSAWGVRRLRTLLVDLLAKGGLCIGNLALVALRL